MRTKIVYALISDCSDYYWEQALISVYSLRLYNPDAVVELVVDTLTATTLDGKRAEIKKYVSRIIIVEIPDIYTQIQRSRYLKTNLRKWVEGDFLFLDCDTVICGKLNEIDCFEGELGLVADINGELPLTDAFAIDRCHQIGFDKIKGKPYYNSGVMYVKDTLATHDFYTKWFENWQHSVGLGVVFDQPALCQTNIEQQFLIQELPGIWNCQFKYSGMKLISEAKIIHYFSGGKLVFIQELTYRKIKETATIDVVTDHAIRNPRTIIYTTYSMSEDKVYEYYNSYMVYLFFCIPSIFRLLEIIGKFMVKPVLMFNKIKR